MATKMIHPGEITFRAVVTEDEIRARMADEVLQQIGGLDDEGKRRKGITVKVNRGSHGGYTIDVTGPTPPQMFLPRAGE
jgi:hypothetical protein